MLQNMALGSKHPCKWRRNGKITYNMTLKHPWKWTWLFFDSKVIFERGQFPVAMLVSGRMMGVRGTMASVVQVGTASELA